MAAKHKPQAKPHTPTHTWSVIIDGTPVTVVAEALEASDGALLFLTDDTIVKAVAHGHWVLANLEPPPPEE